MPELTSLFPDVADALDIESVAIVGDAANLLI